MARYLSDMIHVRTCVYRFYNAADDLLYVGITMNLPGRLSDHRRRDWWSEVVRCDVHWFPGRREAQESEREAINNEHPIHNIARPINGSVTFQDITPSEVSK